MALRQWGRILRGVRIAAFQRTPVVILGAAAFLAPLLGAWWPLVLGGFVYFLMIVCRVASPTWRWQALPSEDAARSAFLKAACMSSPALRTTAAQIRCGCAAMARVLEEASPENRAHVQKAADKVNDLEQCAGGLLWRADGTALFLSLYRRESLQAEAIRLSDQIERITDSQTKRRYQRALDGCREQLVLIEGVEHRYERIMALLRWLITLIDKILLQEAARRLFPGAVEQPQAELDEFMAEVYGELSAAQAGSSAAAPSTQAASGG